MSGKKLVEADKSGRDIKSYIDVKAVLKALEDHVINGTEMSSTQVNAALAILKKAFPDKAESKTDKTDMPLSYEEALKLLE
jgi:hypothetical protein